MTVALLAGCGAAAIVDPSGSPTAPTATEPIATNTTIIPQDAAAFSALAEVAPQSLKLEGGTVTSTACWTPSAHLFRDSSVATATTWKVLCRVYYTLANEDRFQDATCIGDFAQNPMLDHCYVWEYYTGEARFSDGNRLASPAPATAP